jgi:hypothetical protein
MPARAIAHRVRLFARALARSGSCRPPRAACEWRRPDVLDPVIAASLDRQLICDGAFFFVRILERASFALPVPFRTAHRVLVQGPFKEAVRLGVGNWRALCLIFGAFTFGVPLVLVIAAVRRAKHAGGLARFSAWRYRVFMDCCLQRIVYNPKSQWQHRVHLDASLSMVWRDVLPFTLTPL